MENDTACLVWAIFGRAVWRLASNAIEYFEITILGSCKALNRTKLFSFSNRNQNGPTWPKNTLVRAAPFGRCPKTFAMATEGFQWRTFVRS